MSLHVIDPGLATRVVDLGRPSSRSLGVPVGGAADRSAFILGNALVGNASDASAVEICLKGPVLRAESSVGGVLLGAPFSVASARQSLTAGVTFTLQAGEEIHIGGTPEGLRAYLCVIGGFDANTILGSRSGLEPIKPGASLSCVPSSLRRRFYPPQVSQSIGAPSGGGHSVKLRVTAGVQADWFDDRPFYGQVFKVTPALDRMGVRLQSQPMAVPERELVSEPVCPGAVQVTRDGQCIILGVDGQTIGGYPKIAQVIQADLDHLGQLRPGDAIHFQKVELAEGVRLFHEREAFVREWALRARVSLGNS